MADPQPPYNGCPLPPRYADTAYADLPLALRQRVDRWLADHPQ